MNDFMGLDLQTRRRRTKAEVLAIREKIVEVVEAAQPATCRQVFYLLVSAGAVEKTEAEYKGTVVRLLTDMRLEGEIPFGWLADNTRWVHKPSTYSSLQHMLEETKRLYRRALWDDQDDYVEVWCEKDAISGVLYEETAKYDVPLHVARVIPV